MVHEDVVRINRMQMSANRHAHEAFVEILGFLLGKFLLGRGETLIGNLLLDRNPVQAAASRTATNDDIRTGPCAGGAGCDAHIDVGSGSGSAGSSAWSGGAWRRSGSGLAALIAFEASAGGRSVIARRQRASQLFELRAGLGVVFHHLGGELFDLVRLSFLRSEFGQLHLDTTTGQLDGSDLLIGTRPLAGR